jgi:hypothetical protein
MVEAFLRTVDDQEFVDEMLIIGRHIFQLELIEVVLFIVLYAFKRDLDILGSGGSALCDQTGHYFSFVDLSNALNGECPEYLFTDHHQDFALIHAAGVRNERERDLKNAERLDLELAL